MSYEYEEEENEFEKIDNWQDLPNIEHDSAIDGEDSLGMAQSVEFACGACGSVNYIEFDISGGMEQDMIQDCDSCCRPNRIHMHMDGQSGAISVHSTTDI